MIKLATILTLIRIGKGKDHEPAFFFIQIAWIYFGMGSITPASGNFTACVKLNFLNCNWDWLYGRYTALSGQKRRVTWSVGIVINDTVSVWYDCPSSPVHHVYTKTRSIITADRLWRRLIGFMVLAGWQTFDVLISYLMLISARQAERRRWNHTLYFLVGIGYAGALLCARAEVNTLIPMLWNW